MSTNPKTIAKPKPERPANPQNKPKSRLNAKLKVFKRPANHQSISKICHLKQAFSVFESTFNSNISTWRQLSILDLDNSLREHGYRADIVFLLNFICPNLYHISYYRSEDGTLDLIISPGFGLIPKSNEYVLDLLSREREFYIRLNERISPQPERLLSPYPTGSNIQILHERINNAAIIIHEECIESDRENKHHLVSSYLELRPIIGIVVYEKDLNSVMADFRAAATSDLVKSTTCAQVRKLMDGVNYVRRATNKLLEENGFKPTPPLKRGPKPGPRKTVPEKKKELSYALKTAKRDRDYVLSKIEKIEKIEDSDYDLNSDYEYDGDRALRKIYDDIN